MGYDIYGTDIEPGLIEMSQTNLDWLAKESGKTLAPRLEAGDARSHQWTKPFGAVVTEGYLGTPQTAMPSADELDKLQADARDLTLTFLHNLRSQIEPGTPVCITLPAWKQKHGFARLEVIDQILSLGYTSLVFLPVTQADLLYMRPDQFVARELVTLRSN
jgi:tRNA G10  N-methylase Trm11